MPGDVIRKLRPLLSTRRAELIEGVLARRLKGVAVLLEGLYDQGNLVAVLRTCDALGLQRVHCVGLAFPYKSAEAKRVGHGAQKWLDVCQHTDLDAALLRLRAEGYRLVASDLSATRELEDIDVSRPLVLAFGNEREGVSPALRAACDETFRIPMVGFAQSLNIAAAAAITLYSVNRRYRAALGAAGDLTEAERHVLRAAFYRRAVKRSELLVGEEGTEG